MLSPKVPRKTQMCFSERQESGWFSAFKEPHNFWSLYGTSQLLGQIVNIQIRGVHPKDSVSIWEWNPTTITFKDSPWTLLQVQLHVALGQMMTE